MNAVKKNQLNVIFMYHYKVFDVKKQFSCGIVLSRTMISKNYGKMNAPILIL